MILDHCDCPEFAEHLAYVRGVRPIVFTNGVFDLLHSGHLALLNFCKTVAPNPFVVVGINHDHSTGNIKGSHRPLMPFLDRVSVVGNMKSVDLAVGFYEDTPHALLRVVLPDVLVKGGEYASGEKKVEGRELAKAVVFGPLVPNYSTTLLEKRIIARLAPGILGKPTP